MLHCMNVHVTLNILYQVILTLGPSSLYQIAVQCTNGTISVYWNSTGKVNQVNRLAIEFKCFVPTQPQVSVVNRHYSFLIERCNLQQSVVGVLESWTSKVTSGFASSILSIPSNWTEVSCMAWGCYERNAPGYPIYRINATSCYLYIPSGQI